MKISGSVRFGAQKARMTHLYFRKKQSDDGPIVALLFSDHPLPIGVLDDAQKRVALARKKAFVGLYVELDETARVTSTDLLHADGGFSGPWTFEPAARKKGQMGGRVATEGEGDFFGSPYSVDVSFEGVAKPDETWRGSALYETKPTGLKVGQAKGWMERTGRKTTLSHALAVTETDLFGDSGERKLFLTAKPVTDEMLAGTMGPERAMHEAGVEFLRVGLDGKNELQSVMTPAADGAPINFTSSHWEIELFAGTATELDGRVQLAAIEDGDLDFPRFNVEFHAETRAIGAAQPVTAENGKALPKDGGEPGAAYRAFVAALKKAKTVDELLPLRIPAMAAMLVGVPLAERGPLLEFLKEEAKTPYKIVGGFVNADQATLWLYAKVGGEKIDGRVNVHREGAIWKLGIESFRSAPE
ncbi:MAG: hypothetical protein ABIZ04_25705 [Opitutus sp.]